MCYLQKKSLRCCDNGNSKPNNISLEILPEQRMIHKYSFTLQSPLLRDYDHFIISDYLHRLIH